MYYLSDVSFPMTSSHSFKITVLFNVEYRKNGAFWRQSYNMTLTGNSRTYLQSNVLLTCGPLAIIAAIFELLVRKLFQT